jgi:ATP-binding cassette subfamily B protein
MSPVERGVVSTTLASAPPGAPGSASSAVQQQLRFVGTSRDDVTGYAAIAGVDDSRIWTILDRLELKSRFEALDDGLDSLLGREFGGLDLSVGEWQRLALARAQHQAAHLLLWMNPVLLLTRTPLRRWGDC